MNNKWFRIYQGEARGVEYVEENSTTTAIRFYLAGMEDSMVLVPGQANNLKFIKEHDQVGFCGRPSLLNASETVCLAYRINDDETVYSINELRHMTMVILSCIFAAMYMLSSGWKWPLLLIVALISVYYAVSFYWSFRARVCLANARQ
jgi:hypothetical protein